MREKRTSERKAAFIVENDLLNCHCWMGVVRAPFSYHINYICRDTEFPKGVKKFQRYIKLIQLAAMKQERLSFNDMKWGNFECSKQDLQTFLCHLKKNSSQALILGHFMNTQNDLISYHKMSIVPVSLRLTVSSGCL